MAILASSDEKFDLRAKGTVFAFQEILEWKPDIEGEQDDGNVPTEFVREPIDSETSS